MFKDAWLFISSSKLETSLYVCGLAIPSVWDIDSYLNLSGTIFGLNFMTVKTTLGLFGSHKCGIIP